jgi:hypothetical protein
MADTESEIGFAQLGLGSILKQNQLEVPLNQREYAWELKYVQTLFQDLAREIDGDDRIYFLGTIVTIPRPNGSLEIVDGQQRLTTATILLSAIRDYLMPMEKELAESIDNDFLTVFNRQTRTREARLRLNVVDNEYFRQRLTNVQPVPAPVKPSHVLIDSAFAEAARHVRAIVAKLAPVDQGNELNRWVDFIEKKAVAILLRVPNATNAYRMFETLNDRGKRVSQSDLVKNYLFGAAGGRLPEVQQNWTVMRGALESMEDEDTTIMFLRQALVVKRGFVREAAIYEAVQGAVKGQQQSVVFSSDLAALANTLVAVKSPDHERWNKLPDARRALAVLNLFNIGVMWPLLLGVGHVFDENEVSTALQFSVSLAVRLMICNATRTGTVEEGLAGVAHKIGQREIITTEELKRALGEIVPTDGRFRAAFEVATVSNRKLARYYLRCLEMTHKDEPDSWHIPNDDQRVINLEHILPDRPEGNWPQFSEDDVKLFRNRIGNLALLQATDNSTVKSGAFSEKRSILAESPYGTTSQVGKEEDWTPARIDERQKALALIALRAWPI